MENVLPPEKGRESRLEKVCGVPAEEGGTDGSSPGHAAQVHADRGQQIEADHAGALRRRRKGAQAWPGLGKRAGNNVSDQKAGP